MLAAQSLMRPKEPGSVVRVDVAEASGLLPPPALHEGGQEAVGLTTLEILFLPFKPRQEKSQ